MKQNLFRFYMGYLFGKNRYFYQEMGQRYHTHPWVIYRLIHGTSIRSEKELSIFRRLMKDYRSLLTGQNQ